MLIKEIGLEREMWLLDKDDKIIEAPVYNFPADEMGFLVEVRSAWGPNHVEVADTILAAQLAEIHKADKLGFRIVIKPEMKVTDEWQKYIADKYNHMRFSDDTQNIYGKTGHSHNTGLLPGRATAGQHIHFSIWDTDTMSCRKFTELEIHEMVHELDMKFGDTVKVNNRILGEWEPKKHGFEYRSLPCTLDPYEVAYEGWKALSKVSA